jgi:hypothetical protein
MGSSKGKVHSALQTRAFPSAHFDIRDDVVIGKARFAVVGVHALGLEACLYAEL